MKAITRVHPMPTPAIVAKAAPARRAPAKPVVQMRMMQSAAAQAGAEWKEF